MNYNDLNEETKIFINKVMDIYSLIKDKKITVTVKDVIDKEIEYEFTKLDKKILSLFIAGFLINGNLNDIVSQYDDIKLENLFDFIGISEEDINTVSIQNYEEFFDKNIKLDLITITSKENTGKNIKFITPEVLVGSLQYISNMGSKILNFFYEKYFTMKKIIGIFEHPIFKALNNYNVSVGSVEKVQTKKGEGFGSYKSIFNDINFKLDLLSKEKQEQKENKPIELGDNIWEFLEEIKEKFIGQETVAEELFYNIVNNQQLAEMDDIPDGQRAIIFMDGPTGTGKTAITKEITKKLGIPFVSTSITNYSSTGYVGGDLTDILRDLYIQADGDLEKAQRGIVVLDEFDKISYSGSGGLEMKRAVQQQLLDFMGGGKYKVHVGKGMFDSKEVEFDTSKLTFICLGALTDLHSLKTAKKTTLGFENNSQDNETNNYTITPQDLIGIGLERELVGRFNVYLHTNEYTLESLEKILRQSALSPIIGLKKLVESHGKKLNIEDDVYPIIAEQAYNLNTGARGLQTIVNGIRTYYIKDILKGKNDTIYIDAETVIKINNQAINRKGRK